MQKSKRCTQSERDKKREREEREREKEREREREKEPFICMNQNNILAYVSND